MDFAAVPLRGHRSAERRARPTLAMASLALRGAAALALCLTPPCFGGPARPPTRLDRRLGRRIDALAKKARGEMRRAAPGLAVMVVRDGVVVHAKGYGRAALKPARSITRATPFRLASVTKQFTCMAILKLAEEGKLSVDDAALDYVPSLARFGRGVTIRRLMQHTSGLPDYYAELGRRKYKVPSVDDDPLLTAADVSALYKGWGELSFAPGARYSYSNPGYEQLALVIQKVSGRSYGDYLRRALLAPAGMKTAVPRDRPERVIPRRAIGYRKGADGGYEELDDHRANWIVGAGCLYASLDDLYYWDRALREDRLVSSATKAQAFSPGTLEGGRSTGYGFGWWINEHCGRRRVEHGGVWVGFRTTIKRYPDDGVTVVVLANWAGAKPAGLADKIATDVFADRPPAKKRGG